MSFLIKIGTKRPAKVHEIRNGRPVCGGGNGARRVLAWQEDIGPANCRSCALKLKQKRDKEARVAQAKAAKEASEQAQ